jgi:hypothetical protein
VGKQQVQTIGDSLTSMTYSHVVNRLWTLKVWFRNSNVMICNPENKNCCSIEKIISNTTTAQQSGNEAVVVHPVSVSPCKDCWPCMFVRTMAQKTEEELLMNGGDAATPLGDSNDELQQPRRRIFSKLALQRRKVLHDAQAKAQGKLRRKERLKKGLKSARNIVQKLNVGKWIDDLEKDQELADQLEEVNAEFQQEVERKELVIAVREACMDAIRTHLRSFLEENPHGTYEDWIAELHPDNYCEEKQTVDARFYVADSDHRILWNQQHESYDNSVKVVPPSNVEQIAIATTNTKPTGNKV